MKRDLYNARVYMDTEDRRMLDALAKATLRSKAQTVRVLIREAYESLVSKSKEVA